MLTEVLQLIPCPPITRGPVLADLAYAVRAMAADPDAADQHVTELLAMAGWDWQRLLDLRHGYREDVLDALLLDASAVEPPLDCLPTLVGLPAMPHWTAARIALACVKHLRPALLAEVTMRANRDKPTLADLDRLQMLARMAWRARQRKQS